MPRVCRIIALTLPRADLIGSPGVQQLTSGCHCHGRAPRTKGWPRPGRITALDVPIPGTWRNARYPLKKVDLCGRFVRHSMVSADGSGHPRARIRQSPTETKRCHNHHNRVFSPVIAGPAVHGSAWSCSVAWSWYALSRGPQLVLMGPG
jgi:hypothetical protein